MASNVQEPSLGSEDPTPASPRQDEVEEHDGANIYDESADSSYGSADDDRTPASTSSATSSIYKFRKEHGRTYHAYKDGKYAYPNDEIELDRLDLQHCIFLMSLRGKLNLAPINPHVQEVLDVGTGTGLWAMDFADAHPSAQVLGVDLSPSQTDFVPPNLQFEIDDANEPWTFSKNFDFIFCRQLHCAVEERNLMQQAFNFVTPGGWIEMQELCLPPLSDDGTLSEESALSRFYKLLMEASQQRGQHLSNVPHYAEWMREAGFTHVEQEVFKWPSNTWPEDRHDKTIGLWTMHNLFQGLEGFAVALFTRVLGWSIEEVQLLLMDVRKDVKNTNIHAYFPLHIVYGQKPHLPARPSAEE